MSHNLRNRDKSDFPLLETNEFGIFWEKRRKNGIQINDCNLVKEFWIFDRKPLDNHGLKNDFVISALLDTYVSFENN